MTELKLTIPLTPPSVNHYKKPSRSGKYYVTKEAVAFMDAVAILARGEQVDAGRYAVSVFIRLGPKQKGDLDNFAKVILDSLVRARVIDTDAAVDSLFMTKGRALEASTEIQVRVIA